MSRKNNTGIDPQKMKLIRKILFGCLAAAVVIDVILAIARRLEGHLWFEKVPGFSAVAGFAATMGIIAIAKFLGTLFLSRKESHYD